MADDQFTPVTATPVVDPTKHVNYTYGMVLGVDDFTQEFVYHSERDQWAMRDVEGYGTVAGLRVRVALNDANEREVVVSAGAAVNPRGQLICVPTPQCAVVERWLAVARNREAAEQAMEDAPGSALSLYVVLCYRDCPVDQVPIPGEPCRDADETIAPSRLKDGFRLELSTTAPHQTEERAVRELARWLRERVEFSDDPAADYATEEEFAAALRADAEAICSFGPDAPASPVESPPSLLVVPASLRCEYLNIALRIWVTEFRPRVRPEFPDASCSCGEGHAANLGDGDCVLLAELSVPVTNQMLVDTTGEVGVVETNRPVLVHQRLLQELILCGGCCGVSSAAAGASDTGTSISPPPETVTELVTMSQSSDEDGTSYFMWFHPDPADDRPIVNLSDGAISVFGGGGGGGGGDEEALAPDLRVESVEGQNNLFRVRPGGGSGLIGFRLNFDLIAVFPTPRLRRSVTLAAFAAARRIRYTGQHAGGEAQLVTLYAPPPAFAGGVR